MISLLQKNSLTVRKRFVEEKFALNLSERASTATITVGPEAPEIAVNDWLRDEEDPGAGIVWRVRNVATDFATNTRTIACEHLVSTLRDLIMFGEISPATITGNAKSVSCSARDTVVYILNRTPDWTLGTFGYSKAAPYSFNGESLFDALERVSSSLYDAWWSYDFSRYPFRISINPKKNAVECEMREDRNIRSMKRTIDRTRMFTRFYPIGKNNIHITGDYVEKNANLYGVVSKVETDSEKDTEQKLRDWASERLNNHCEPAVTVSISGLDLSEATGEPMDRLQLGTVCRVPLPEYGTTIVEPITQLNWQDKRSDPESVNITLANVVEDVATIVNQLSKSAGSGGRSRAKEQEEDHAWFVDTTTHVAMVAEAVAGEGADRDWSRVSSIVVDGEGIHQRVVRTEGEIVATWAAIEVLDDKITLEVASAKSDTYSKIEQTAESITSTVNSAKSSLWSGIMQTATNIYTQVGNAKSDTYSKIEQTASSITSTVNSAKSSLWSGIMQTSTNIYTQVGNAKSDTYSYVNQTASSITSTVASAKSALWSGIMQTSTNIYTQVGNAKSDTYSYVDQTASSITSTVASAKSSLWSGIMQTSTNIYTQVGNAKSDAYSYVDQTASSITSTVASAKSSLWSGIMQTSTNISLKVGKGEVISCINQTAESITINASKINLEGYVQASDITADYVAGKIAEISSMSCMSASFSGSIRVASAIYLGASASDTSKNLATAYKEMQITTSGNTYTLQKKSFNDTSWQDVGTFSRAVGSWSVGGGSGKVNVTANPQNQTKSVTVSIGGPNTITSNGTNTYKVYYENADGDDVETGASMSVETSVTPTKAQIGASRGSRQSSQPSADASLSGVTANGWYVITVSCLGQSKTFRLEVDV